MSSHKPRSTNFNVAEDRHLCSVFLDISQDPIVGRNQSKDIFWKRIAEKYHSERSYSHIADRSQRSLQCRMQIILRDIRKFNGCVQQIEYQNPSGANEQTILEKATEKLMTQQGYASGFKFNHVWSLLKDYVQVETIGRVSSFPKKNIADSPNDSLSSFEINLSSDGGCSSRRPEGVKKSKLKRKQHEDAFSAANIFKEENDKLRELIASSNAKKDLFLEVQMKKIDAQMQKVETQNRTSRINELKRDDKILLINLDTISDPARREFIRLEQQEIMQKRRQPQQANSSTFNMFGMNFPNIGGTGGGLSDY